MRKTHKIAVGVVGAGALAILWHSRAQAMQAPAAPGENGSMPAAFRADPWRLFLDFSPLGDVIGGQIKRHANLASDLQLGATPSNQAEKIPDYHIGLPDDPFDLAVDGIDYWSI